ncbi:MAG: hypothetical protein WBA10_10785 [Elainellaceae cyanobacterium]
MTSIQQADRQWLNHLYSKSPCTALEYGFFRGYHRLKQKLLSLKQGCCELTSTQIISTEDCYGNLIWYAYNPALDDGISTYSRPTLQRWLVLQTYLDSRHSASTYPRQRPQKDG